MKRISGKIHWEVVFNARNTELVQNNKKHCTIRSGHKVCENDTLRLVDDEGYTIYEMVLITRVRTVVVTYSRNCGFTMLVDGCVQTAQQAEDAAQEVGFDTLDDLGRFLLNEYRKMPDYVFSGQLISWLQVTNE